MANLTAEQANDLSNNFLGMAQAIGNYRYTNHSILSRADYNSLGNMQRSAMNYGEDILAFSTMLVMNDVNDSLAQINDITQNINDTSFVLTGLQKTINIAALILTLGGAIVSENPQAIVSSIINIYTALKEK